MRKQIFLLGIVFLISLSFVSAHYYKPVIYYEFEADGTDTGTEGSHTYNYDLTLVNTPTFPTGFIGNGMDCEKGSSEYAHNISANVSKIRTIEMWVKPESWTHGEYGRFLTIRDAGNTEAYTFSDSSNAVTWQLGGTAWQPYVTPTIASYPATTWTHIVTIFGTDGWDIYMNGTLISNTTDTDVFSSTPDHIEFCNYNTGAASNFYDGMIDNVAMFEEEYTPTDVAYAWNDGIGRNYSATSLINLLTPTDNSANSSPLDFTYNVTSPSADLDFCSLYTNSTGQFNPFRLDGVVSYYPFRINHTTTNITRDYFGSNDGTVYGAIYNSTGGYDGNGTYEFDGVNDRINIPYSSSLNFSGNDEITITGWAKYDGGKGNDAIISQSTEILIDKSGSTIRLILNSFTGDDRAEATSLVTPLDGSYGWFHFAGTYDGTNISIFINGVKEESVTPTGVYGGITNNFIIGDGLEEWNGSIDEVLIFNRSLTPTEITDLYTNGIYAHNQVNESPINNTNNYFRDVSFTDGSYIWNVECYNMLGNSSFDPRWAVSEDKTLTIDSTIPTITPEPDLGNNNIVVYNTSLETYINFSDDREIYSINVTYGNGTSYYNETNLGVTSQQVNISDIISQAEKGLLNLTARVCDAHTLTSISDIDWSDKDNGLDFIMKKKWWLFRDEWVHIYPKSYSEYNTPTTYKDKDRYPFIFNNKDVPSVAEVFVVESSDYIDIIGNKNYQGHLIMPNIGENGYWVDFDNEESTKTEIKRISDTKVEVTVYGLKSKIIEFNSIGELNCVSETFYFNNLAPSTGYSSNVIVGDATTIYLNVTEDSAIITKLNATLWYNDTAYYVSATSNFTKSVTAPLSVDGNTSLIPFYWSVNVDGTEYNLTSYNQNVSDFYLDDCSAYSTEALNFTIIDEETSVAVNADWTGRFNYSYNGIKKYYDLTVTADNTTQMCIFPNNITFTNSDDYIYYSEAGYPQRKYTDTAVTIDNVTDDIVMYALASADGIYGRFKVVDTYTNSIEGASGLMKKEIGGVWTTMEGETSDGSGLMTFWLNPDTTYQFIFSKTGYGSVTEKLRVTTTEIYTVTLGSIAEERNQSYSVGVSYGFYPNYDLQNATNYDFSFVMESDYWDITGCTLYLKNGSNIINTSSTSYTTRVCNISIELNTDSYTTITSQAIYNLNSSDDITASTQYTIAYRYIGDFSLKSFLDDLKAFGGAGFNDFTRMVIAFIIIFIILASVAYNMGVIDPEVTIGLLIMLTWFFSYIGWLTLPYDGIRTEWLKQYIIAILITLGGGSFIIKRATQ